MLLRSLAAVLLLPASLLAEARATVLPLVAQRVLPVQLLASLLAEPVETVLLLVLLKPKRVLHLVHQLAAQEPRPVQLHVHQLVVLRAKLVPLLRAVHQLVLLRVPLVPLLASQLVAPTAEANVLLLAVLRAAPVPLLASLLVVPTVEANVLLLVAPKTRAVLLLASQLVVLKLLADRPLAVVLDAATTLAKSQN